MSKGRNNPGRFRPGPDSRRHKFTKAESRRGGQMVFKMYSEGLVAFSDPKIAAWYFRKIRKHYKVKERE